MRSYILSIDQGTTSSRAALVDATGSIIHIAQQEIRQIYRQPGWVEHDPLEILTSVQQVISRCIQDSGISPDTIQAIGITNQRETTVIWDKTTGKPLDLAVVWQSRQTQDICQQLKSAGLEPLFREKTCLLIDPYFSGTKVKWLLDQHPGAREKAERGQLLFGTIDSWLIWNLTGGAAHVTDRSNASRTLMYNIHSHEWDTELLAHLEVPRAMLPNICGNAEVIAHINGHPIIPDGTPICGIAGDQQAALFGQGCFEAGMAKNTYGTGCFLLMNTGTEAVRSEHGLLTSVAWELHGKIYYALEGSIFVAGSAVQWLRDGLKLITSAAETEQAAQQTSSSEGVYFVPAFVGLGAPYWSSESRGAIFGLTRGSRDQHLIRATLEAIAYQTKDVIDAMEQDAGQSLTTLRVDGGATANSFLMQFQSDILDVPVQCARYQETTILGAAFLAGLGVGIWQDEQELIACWQASKSYTPLLDHELRNTLYEGWKRAVRATISY